MRAEENEDAKVTPLREPQPVIDRVPPPSPAKGLHGVAIAGMALFAIVGIALLLALITVNWTDSSRSIIITIIVLIVVGFIASAATAVFAAARETHPDRSRRPESE